MAFASKAHRSKMRELLALGRITKAQYDAMEEGTPDHIPDRGSESEDSKTEPAAKKKRPNPFW